MAAIASEGELILVGKKQCHYEEVGLRFCENKNWNLDQRVRVTASCYRSLDLLAEVEEPAEMGASLGTDQFCLQ